jgi:hypothetical protein
MFFILSFLFFLLKNQKTEGGTGPAQGWRQWNREVMGKRVGG